MKSTRPKPVASFASSSGAGSSAKAATAVRGQRALRKLTAAKPEKSLVKALKKTGGRNNLGRVTARRRGGGHKRRYRLIDFKRDKDEVPARVTSVEYDPNRSCRIALLTYADGERRYILAPHGLRVGQQVRSGEKVDPKPGNAMPDFFPWWEERNFE